jgi:hypothetical protein
LPNAHNKVVKSPINHNPKPSAHQLHQRADKAHTLMRGALKRPSGQFSAKIQRLTPGFNPQREIRAKTTAKHNQVEHFGDPAAAPSKPKPQIVHGEVIRRHPGHSNLSSGPSPSSTAVALPSMITSASHQKLERMLDEALTKADSHKQALRYHAARHFWQRPGFMGRRAGLKIALILIIVLGISGLLAWQKVPQLSIKVAGVRTHVDASIPAYRPSGYSLITPASINNGAVLLKYQDSADTTQGYNIAQKSSNLASLSLAQTVVPHGAQVQTTQVSGNTVYIYGANNNAAWVNNGVLYTISDHARLSSDEIIKIVQGLN